MTTMEDSLRKPVLQVGEINDEEIDMSVPPASGEEYIKRVVLESRKCAGVVYAEIDKKKLKEPAVYINIPKGCVKAPRALAPTLEWQYFQISDFVKVRLYISRLRSHHKIRPDCPLDHSDEALPSINDKKGWIEFCSSSAGPTLNAVFFLPQSSVEQILEYLIMHVEKEESLEPQLGRWLYGLMAVLRNPAPPSICSSLRILARTCSVIRSKKDTKVEAQPLNLFICLVGRYFHQLDLADP